MQFTEKDLTKLIADVEVAFADHLAKAESEAALTAPLTKAEDEKPAEKKEDKPSEDKAEAKPEAKEESKEEQKEAPKADAEAKPEGEAAAAPAAEAKPENEAAEQAGEASNAIYDSEDMQHLEKMYMSMSKDEQLVHHDVLRKCMDAAQAAPAADAAQAAPAAEIDKCGDMSMSKTEKTEAATIEVKAEDVKASPELELAKSEAAAAQAKAETLQKNLDAVQEFLTKLVKKVPQGKAITSYEQVAKSEAAVEEGKELSKSEINTILGQKAADPSLKKSDRDAINAFYLNGANINTISHLLTKSAEGK